MAQQTALITGSSTGIGEACAARLASKGWKVYAGVRKTADGERLVETHRGDLEPVIIDVCDQATIDDAIEHISAAGTGLDGLVNNAGVGEGGALEASELDDWRSVFEVNFFGLIAVTQAAFPLVDQNNGRFVHIGSIAGRVASPGLGPYAASKHAVSALNWALRGELANVGRMHSSVIEPGEIKTEIWAKGDQQLIETEAKIAAAGLTDRYQWLLDMFHGFLAEAHEKAIEPAKVADAVEHALTAKRPKARYVVGPDARVQAMLAKLPDRAREAALGKAWNKYISDGVKLRTGG